MSNILKRPMFRSGGKVDGRGTGITSGLDAPRQNYKDGDIVESYKEKLARLRAERPALSLGDYLQIAATGAQIAGAPGRGAGLGDSLVAASGPLANLGMGLSKSIGGREAGMRELAGQLTGLEIEKELKEKGLDSKSYADTNKVNLIRASLKKITELKKSLESADEATKSAIQQQIKSEERILETLYGRDQTIAQIIKAAPELVQDFIENFKDNNGRNPTLEEIKQGLSGPGFAEGGRVGFEEGGIASFKDFVESTGDDALMDLYVDFLNGQIPEDVLKEALAKKGYKTYANGGAVEPVMDPMQEAEQPENEKPVELSYDELRSRLPEQITDDIVQLLATSYEALADFAQIQTQADVNAFNSKYQVNLVLPQEA